ncbi:MULTISPECIES: zinc dependent phospholipase C family protein [Pontibacillus]|uniref:Zinc dependent phospholipase C family protein n=1 Tax=Pontibacillus chungwhensis TaxID=265426 RepID=A0ABY8V0Y4_9BACI|nr:MULTISPECIES: zinc dependent phospholipase C family protein [Pontibacillus]MCD5324933.1 zinc dependent phospholipase C family protein [Pontibacillus sp. HN14]WIF98892.1 zinc dependent phospholipase C family protein [Pontibacillus chungwhensis]
MPNIWTHILFAEDIMDGIKAQGEFQTTGNYVNLGAQGPDPFFYHNFWPWKKDESINKIGNVLHHEACGPFLIDLIAGASELNQSTKAYVLGFVTHHILDRNTHPFIHYFAGYEKNKHQKLEVIIDTIMMERFRHLKTWKTPVYREIDVGPALDVELTAFLTQKISFFFPQVVSSIPADFVHAAYQDMKRAFRVLYDPYGWKNALLGQLVSSFSHQPIASNKDFLNTEHRTWYHSATNEPRSESFLDLYEEARREGLEICSEILLYWEEPTDEGLEKISSLIQNISYDTGKPVSENAVNQYSNPIV